MAQVPRPSWISSNEGRTPLKSDKELTFWIQLPELFLHQASSSSGDIVIVLLIYRWFFFTSVDLGSYWVTTDSVSCLSGNFLDQIKERYFVHKAEW